MGRPKMTRSLPYLTARSNKSARIADRFRGNQNTLGIHTVENVVEAPVFFTDQVFFGNFQVMEEQLVGFMVDHGIDFPDFDGITSFFEIH